MSPFPDVDGTFPILSTTQAIRKLDLCRAKNDAVDFDKSFENAIKLADELIADVKGFLKRRAQAYTTNFKRKQSTMPVTTGVMIPRSSTIADTSLLEESHDSDSLTVSKETAYKEYHVERRGEMMTSDPGEQRAMSWSHRK